MAARPPQRDTETPGAIEFGIAALQPYLEDAEVEYPVTSGELVAALGDPAVPVDAHGRTVSLSAVVEDTARDEFESERDLLDALHPVFERYRERASGGFLASLRGLLPF